VLVTCLSRPCCAFSRLLSRLQQIVLHPSHQS
jgi:hypothetical protein